MSAALCSYSLISARSVSSRSVRWRRSCSVFSSSTAKDAALIAVSILALQDAGLAAKLDAFRAKQTADVLKAEL